MITVFILYCVITETVGLDVCGSVECVMGNCDGVTEAAVDRSSDF